MASKLEFPVSLLLIVFGSPKDTSRLTAPKLELPVCLLLVVSWLTSEGSPMDTSRLSFTPLTSVLYILVPLHGCWQMTHTVFPLVLNHSNKQSVWKRLWQVLHSMLGSLWVFT